MADKTVVVADLLIDGKSLGPHAFLMSLRENGEQASPPQPLELGYSHPLQGWIMKA
jgi:hypothetical protein